MSTYKLKVNSAKVSGTHTDYPAYVDLGNMPASFWSTVTNGGGDIRVYSNENLSTQLPREVVTCDTSDDSGELRIKTGLSTTTEIYITVDGSSTEPASDSTYGSENTWNSNYKAVYHMKDATDSTSNGNDGTVSGATSGATGQIGDAYDFDGTNDYINLGDNDLSIANGYTLSTWVNLDALSTGNSSLIQRDKSSPIYGRFFQFKVSSTGQIIFIRFNSSNDVSTNIVTTTTISTGTYALIHATFDTTDGAKIYIDGDEEVSDTNTTANRDGTGCNILVGARVAGLSTPTDYIDGKMGETRIYVGTSPSSNRISTEYNNQSDVDTFWTISEGNTQGLMPFFLKG